MSNLSPPPSNARRRLLAPSQGRQRGRSALLGLVSIGLLLGLWQWGAQAYPPVILPPPSAVGIALQRLIAAGQVGPAIAATLFHVLAGFGVAVLGGGLLGMAAGNQSLLRQAIAPVASTLLGTPPIAWLVLTMVWFGLGHTNSIFTVAVTIGPLVFTGTAEAIGTLNPQLLNVAQVYQIKGWMRFQALYWPYLVSRLLPLLVTGLSLAWRVAIMSEVLATPSGIGAELNTARANLDTAAVMAWIVITILCVLASDVSLRQVQQRLLPWQQANTPQPHGRS